MNFIICEDNFKQRSIIESIIRKHLKENSINGDIKYSSHDPNQVVDYLKKTYNNEDTNIYFLDVDLQNEINGLTLGKKIREIDTNGYIIYITAHTELSMVTFQYKLQALDYISKYNTEALRSNIIECINTIHAETSTNLNNKLDNKTITIKSGSKYITKPVKDIVFLETSSREHMLILYTQTDRIEFYGTFKNILAELGDECFYQCHKSYVVNKSFIEEIDKKNKTIKMANGKICYTSGKYLKGLIESV